MRITQQEFEQWQAVTESSQYRWVEDKGCAEYGLLVMLDFRMPFLLGLRIATMKRTRYTVYDVKRR